MRLLALRGRLALARRSAASAAPAPPEATARPAAAAAAAPAETAPPPGSWTMPRLRLVEALWGEGFLLPGGAAEVLRLAVPLGLSAASSILLLGAGSGGPSVRLAGDLGVWVRGHEADPFLTEMAARRIQRAGVALAKRATIASWNPSRPAFDRRAFDHALTLEALCVTEPQHVLEAMAQAVRPGGQIALLETVAPTPLDPADPAVAAWLRTGPDGALLPDPVRIGAALEQLGFAVRVAEDVSPRHIRLAVRGWRLLLRSLATDRPDAAQAALLIAEADRWLRRIRLMRAGRIRMMRWLAVERRRSA